MTISCPELYDNISNLRYEVTQVSDPIVSNQAPISCNLGLFAYETYSRVKFVLWFDIIGPRVHWPQKEFRGSFVMYSNYSDRRLE